MENLLNKYNTNIKFHFIGKINGLANESKRATLAIHNKKEAEVVSRLVLRKLSLGKDIRHHLLAYAFVRGKSYSELESKCRNDNKPCAKKIYEIIINNFSGYCWNYTNTKLSEDLISKWLGN